ncbi:MAG: hypothetical protein M1832_005162 [Thelocarpon impressellum]|nr:MAG: hypothetical protein M1832_005162 [Thelocarpon impressellum]
MASLDEPEKPWHAHVTVDLLARVLQRSIFHPFIAWLMPLCLRAMAASYDHPYMRYTIGYAVLISLLSLARLVDTRAAYGASREVDLENEVVVVTGGARGLGLLVAEVYGMRGASVAVLDVRRLDGEARGIAFYECDVGDRKQVEAAAKRIEQDLGTPTILINNAAVVHGKPLLELSPSEIEQTFRVNLLSHYHTLQVFLPGMLASATGGTIVTVSSVLGQLGASRLSDYAASKAALLALHSSLTAELAPHPRIKTVLVAPGQLSTPLFRGVRTPSAFLAPVVEAVDVAKEVIAFVDGGRGGEIRLPLYARWVGWWAVLPPGVQRALRWAAGVDRAMERFVGRGKVE